MHRLGNFWHSHTYCEMSAQAVLAEATNRVYAEIVVVDTGRNGCMLHLFSTVKVTYERVVIGARAHGLDAAHGVGRNMSTVGPNSSKFGRTVYDS
jgi:hypothetical protein